MSIVNHCPSVKSWRIAEQSDDIYIRSLEQGQVLFFPGLAFDDHVVDELLTPDVLSEKSKNVSYDPNTASAKGCADHCGEIKAMMAHYAQSTSGLLENLLPHYRGKLILGKTSYRPVQTEGRKSSYRKDDSLLHIDSFPSMPVHGKRILRVFSNINPYGETRDWRVGASLENAFDHCLDSVRPPLPFIRRVMSWLKLTKSYRSEYDHYMLNLHHAMKRDPHFQVNAPQERMNFPARSSWLVFTDQVPHAAMRGQYLMEQTFYLDVEDMLQPETSPLYRLRKRLQAVKKIRNRREWKLAGLVFLSALPPSMLLLMTD